MHAQVNKVAVQLIGKGEHKCNRVIHTCSANVVVWLLCNELDSAVAAAATVLSLAILTQDNGGDTLEARLAYTGQSHEIPQGPLNLQGFSGHNIRKHVYHCPMP